MTRWHPRAKSLCGFDSYADFEIRHLCTARAGTEKQRPSVKQSEPCDGGCRRPHIQAVKQALHSCGFLWLTVLTGVNGDHVFNSGAAKQAFYELITREIVCLSAEHDGERTTWVDTMRSHDADNAVICIKTTRSGLLVSRSAPLQTWRSGSEDCLFFANREDKGADCVWHTCDCDSVGQSVCLGLRCFIMLSGLQLVEPFKLPQVAAPWRSFATAAITTPR